MSQLGERLRAARETQGIPISQAAADTRILPRYIHALEGGDFAQLPGDVYARGFIRNYANYLNVHAEELIELYRVERGITDPITISRTTSAPQIRGLFVPSFFGVFFVVIVLMGLSYLALSMTNNLGDPQLASAPVPTSAPTPQPLPTWPASPTAAPELVAAPTAASAAPVTTPEVAGGAAPTAAPTVQPATPGGAISAAIRIAPGDHRGSWIKITADRAVIFEGILEANSVYPFAANTNVKIRAGNAGVVYVSINGLEQGPLGSEGRVFDFSWPPQ
ncbi:MAG: helix-turn-helix domain-containing protein [Roseiflexaceae bacterium]|nr:helix-turn-helix domain-containing protein [Roseiflexaceae bacterium]